MQRTVSILQMIPIPSFQKDYLEQQKRQTHQEQSNSSFAQSANDVHMNDPSLPLFDNF